MLPTAWPRSRAGAPSEKPDLCLLPQARHPFFSAIDNDIVEVSPQRHLFRLYHEIYRSRVPALPALLPEVWLHWDPKTVRQRGPEALLRHRMDFLLLLPHGRRVVLEVDGAHHHRTAAAYADTVRGDRELKLTGADVYRFGAAELSDLPRARPVMEIFFTDLFDAYEIPVPQDPR